MGLGSEGAFAFSAATPPQISQPKSEKKINNCSSMHKYFERVKLDIDLTFRLSFIYLFLFFSELMIMSCLHSDRRNVKTI